MNLKIIVMPENENENEIQQSELIEIGCEELYYNCYECPKCKEGSISFSDNYCCSCGVKIIKPENNN